jgi:maleate cis-trans isomerase
MNEQAGKTRLGVIKPTTTSNSLADLQGLLPDDIEMIPEYMGFAYKSLDEFRASMPIYGDNVAALAARGVDLIHPEGAPPFMLQGLAEETRLIEEWQAKHGVPVFTTGTTQVAAMRALGIERFVGYTPFTGELAAAFRQYFIDAGFDVLFMGKPISDEGDVYDLTTEEIRDRIIDAFAKEPGDPQALYILGSGWRVFDVMEELEAALNVPVLHPVAVRCWYILSNLGRAAPITGHGRLLATMPPMSG